MKNRTNIVWPDLADITAVVAPLLTAVSQCEIRCRGRAQANLLLLPEEMFSLIGHAMVERTNDDVLIGLGRMIASHVTPLTALATGSTLFRELKGLERSARSTEPLTWRDLPGATFTPFVPHHEIHRFGLRAGRQAALLFTTHDHTTPLSWVQFSDSTPARNLLIALGRTLVAQHDLVRHGGRSSPATDLRRPQKLSA